MRIAAWIPPLEIGRFMRHAKPTMILGIYAHLFEDNHADAMAALGAMGLNAAEAEAGNVIRLQG